MRAAFGKICLTPADYLGRTLAGYTPIQVCTGKYDDIFARGVLIDNPILGNIHKYFLILSLDYLQLPLLFTEYVKEQIQDRYQIHPSQILIHATHTHKSLDMGGLFIRPGGYEKVIWGIMFGAYHGDDKYKVWVAAQIVKLVGKLLASLRPAQLAWTKQEVPKRVVLNRRAPSKKPYSKMGVWAFRDLKTKEIFGMIVSFGMHPTTLSHAVTKLSADYPGKIAETITELSNGSIETVYITAPAGDLNPITTCGYNFAELEKDKDPIYLQKGDIRHTTIIGRYLGKFAYAVGTAIPETEYFDSLDIRSNTKTFWIPMKNFTKYHSPAKFSNSAVHWIKKNIIFPVALMLGDRLEPNFPGYAVKHRGRDLPNVYTQEQYVRIKATRTEPNGTLKERNLAIVGVPGELFEGIANKIYQRTPTGETDTFIFQNANDWVAYLFTLKDYVEGGYEPFASYAAICGTYIQFIFYRFLTELDTGIGAGFY
jgi:hypothetical protein